MSSDNVMQFRCHKFEISKFKPIKKDNFIEPSIVSSATNIPNCSNLQVEFAESTDQEIIEKEIQKKLVFRISTDAEEKKRKEA